VLEQVKPGNHEQDGHEHADDDADIHVRLDCGYGHQIVLDLRDFLGAGGVAAKGHAAAASGQADDAEYQHDGAQSGKDQMDDPERFRHTGRGHFLVHDDLL